jgi:AcrR family transcriptional regulator
MLKQQRQTQAERRAATRARLLDAARSTFAARGYYGASLDAISEAAGCTKGALYHHFGSKEGLFLALLEQQYAQRLDQAGAGRAERSDPRATASQRLPFDREFALLFLEFVCAAAREAKVRRRLATSLRALRAQAADFLGDARLADVLGAVANGASIEALIFGPAEGAATFDAALERIGLPLGNGSP